MRRWEAWHNALLTHDEMAREVLIDSPLAHGTAMLRRRALERMDGWSERGWAEDLDLWVRLLDRGARFAKLPRTLYGWRQHAASSTRTDPRYARERFRALKLETLVRRHLRRRRAVTLVGVGASLSDWTGSLRGKGLRVTVRAAARPNAAFAASAPVVLVFGAAPARGRWRDHLASRGLREGEDFVFVA
jgi:hypothetical protein